MALLFRYKVVLLFIVVANASSSLRLLITTDAFCLRVIRRSWCPRPFYLSIRRTCHNGSRPEFFQECVMRLQVVLVVGKQLFDCIFCVSVGELVKEGHSLADSDA